MASRATCSSLGVTPCSGGRVTIAAFTGQHSVKGDRHARRRRDARRWRSIGAGADDRIHRHENGGTADGKNVMEAESADRRMTISDIRRLPFEALGHGAPFRLAVWWPKHRGCFWPRQLDEPISQIVLSGCSLASLDVLLSSTYQCSTAPGASVYGRLPPGAPANSASDHRGSHSPSRRPYPTALNPSDARQGHDRSYEASFFHALISRD